MYFDRFDICEAYYCYFVEWHGGGGSREYQRLGKLLQYLKPRHDLSSETLEDNGREIYDQLVAKVTSDNPV